MYNYLFIAMIFFQCSLVACTFSKEQKNLENNSTENDFKKNIFSPGVPFRDSLKKYISWDMFSSVLWSSQLKSEEVGRYVVGDIDGSLPRLVLAALVSGYIELDSIGVHILKTLLIKEDEVLREKKMQPKSDNPFTIYQRDQDIYRSLSNLLSHITYKNSKHKLVILGDFLFDRFTNNLRAMIELCSKLHDLGVFFIKGNHEFKDLDDGRPQGGGERNKTGEEAISIDYFASRCLLYAFFDEDMNILYTHTALGQVTGGIQYCNNTVYESTIDAKTLADRINKSEILAWEMTGFRPDNHIDKYVPINFLHIHGHDHFISNEFKGSPGFVLRNELSGALSLNPRDGDIGYLPSIVLIK
jgi:hypothetical protein